MRVAILGAGFAGLATTWYLLYHTRGGATIDLYDPIAIGSGVSGISSGLLHSFAGKHAKKARDAEEKINSVHRLLQEAAMGAGKPLVISKGILRPAVTREQIDDFKKCALQNPDETLWWDKESCEDKVKGLVIKEKDGGGLFIKHGLTIDVPTYMAGLWQSCALLGSQYHQTALLSEKDLKRYDRIVFAVGYATKGFKPLSHLPIELIKGQVLQIKWPQDIPPLPHSLISEGYLVMSPDRKTCIAGSTYERKYTTTQPDLETALPEIRRKIEPFFPSIAQAEIVSCNAGVRAASQHNHLPVVGKLSDKFWFATGLGSKGLLYHAWIGDALARALIFNNPNAIPPEVRYG